jgi:hypothetical protein
MARAGALLGWCRLLALAAGIASLAACKPAVEADPVGGALIPELASRQDHVDRLVLHGPGKVALVTLARSGGEWRLAERGGWRADGGRIAQYLAQLAQARRVEAKTASAAMYPRLALEDIADPGAGGTELTLSGKDIAQRLLIGKAHKTSGGRYVRLAGRARTWLTDIDVGFDPDPVAWIDRRLLDVPLARVQQVRIRPRSSPAFMLVHRDDRFRPDDAPPAAMHDSHVGDEIAAALQEFDIDDVAADDGGQPAAQELDYELVDGAVLTVAVWREGQRDWARISSNLDEGRAAEWSRLSGRAEIAGRARAAVAGWKARFGGRKFLLPPALADTLMQDHSQILEGHPPEPEPEPAP